MLEEILIKIDHLDYLIPSKDLWHHNLTFNTCMRQKLRHRLVFAVDVLQETSRLQERKGNITHTTLNYS